MYQEKDIRPKSSRLPNPRDIGSISVSAALELLVKAGYHIVDGTDLSQKGDLGT